MLKFHFCTLKSLLFKVEHRETTLRSFYTFYSQERLVCHLEYVKRYILAGIKRETKGYDGQVCVLCTTVILTYEKQKRLTTSCDVLTKKKT